MYKMRFVDMDFINYGGHRVKLLRITYLCNNSVVARKLPTEKIEEFLSYLDSGAR